MSFVSRRQQLVFSKHIWIFLLLLSVGGIFGLDPISSLIEVIVLLYLFVVFSEVYIRLNTLEKRLAFLKSCYLALFLASFLAFLTMLGVQIPFLAMRNLGESSGSFRNAGQFGSYSFTLLALLLPLKLAGYSLFKGEGYILAFTVLILIASAKMSSIIGLSVATIFLLLSGNGFKYVKIMSVLAILIYFILPYIGDLAFISRFERKWNSRILVMIVGGEMLDEGSFTFHNWKLALQEFVRSPITGTGIGAFYKNVASHEVHSTYIKILGETGLLGVFGYCALQLEFLRRVFFKRSEWTKSYIVNLMPFLLGLYTTWIYTYHIRKREYWLFYIGVLVVLSLYKNDEE